MTHSIFGGRKIVPGSLEKTEKDDFHIDSYIGILKKNGISDWEQVFALLSKNEHRNGLAKLLNLTEVQTDQLTAHSELALPSLIREELKTAATFSFPLGAKKYDRKLTREHLNQNNTVSNQHSLSKLSSLESFIQTANLQLASSVNYVSQLPPVRSQGDRGTCVAFAVSAINEFSFSRKLGRNIDLSEQYLFFETKKLEGDTGCGSRIADALTVISEKGQCPEETWSYNPHLPCFQSAGEPSNADDRALPYRNGYVPFNDTDDLLLQIKGCLSLAKLIAFSIPVYGSWYQNADTQKTGRIIMPFPGEVPLKDSNGNDEGHAMAIVGYQDDSGVAGGGYFIIRNSWGEQLWGSQNHYAPGYGIIPYAYIINDHWEIYAL